MWTEAGIGVAWQGGQNEKVRPIVSTTLAAWLIDPGCRAVRDIGGHRQDRTGLVLRISSAGMSQAESLPWRLGLILCE